MLWREKRKCTARPLHRVESIYTVYRRVLERERDPEAKGKEGG